MRYVFFFVKVQSAKSVRAVMNFNNTFVKFNNRFVYAVHTVYCEQIINFLIKLHHLNKLLRTKFQVLEGVICRRKWLIYKKSLNKIPTIINLL